MFAVVVAVAVGVAVVFAVVVAVVFAVVVAVVVAVVFAVVVGVAVRALRPRFAHGPRAGRQGLPVLYAGASPRYSREAVTAWMESRKLRAVK